MKTLWMALCALARLWPGALAGCAEAGRCCPGRDPACFARGWRLDRVYGTCFCDQACSLTGDCCFDYARACPARPCLVGEWSPWSGCADQCKPTNRVRRRSVLQEPQNGGTPCPPLEERAGCLNYATLQGQDCGHSFVPAFITTSAFNKERTRQAASPQWSTDIEDAGYCMEFKTESLTHHCALENRPLTRWMQYLREGYTKSDSPLASNWQSSMSRNLEESPESRSVFLSSCPQFYFYIDYEVNISYCVYKHVKY
ncbi:somatomedin-B and thrombospondin type-1 domain-containing protein isoform X2 [Tamandua tetradactyla]|uniref:somatomedin-B and thrombospondin type-1 domain-containing protein isoform X2 n=1 Tax=Tamandua tetradactyla TaxID=48850 RepID=UPI00405388EB